MNILQLIFRLVHDFVQMPSSDFAKIKAEGEDWYSSIRCDEDLKKPTLLETSKKYAERWYSKLAISVSYIFLKRWIFDYMNGGSAVEPDVEHNYN